MGDLVVGGGLVQRAQSEERLEACHRGAPAVVAKDVLVPSTYLPRTGYRSHFATQSTLATVTTMRYFPGRDGILVLVSPGYSSQTTPSTIGEGLPGYADPHDTGGLACSSPGHGKW